MWQMDACYPDPHYSEREFAMFLGDGVANFSDDSTCGELNLYAATIWSAVGDQPVFL
jgi:hypothetical protein